MAAYMDTGKQHPQVWHLRDTSKTSQTHLWIKNISNIIIRDGNNSIDINMLSVLLQ